MIFNYHICINFIINLNNICYNIDKMIDKNKYIACY